MLIGHYAPALVLGRQRPALKLWWLFIATQWVDVLWAVFIFSGVEHARIVKGFTASNDLDLWDMPYTHSLAATFVWAALTFVVWRVARRAATADALAMALAVASHFVCDLIVHAPDLPIAAAQGPKLGFGLWEHRFLALGVETALFGAAALYWWWPRRDRPGARVSGACLLGLTVLTAGTYFIPTPPSPTMMALTGLATYASTAFIAAFVDRKSGA